MALIKQGVAYTRMFFMVLNSDHISPATGKTLNVTVSKSGAGFAAPVGTITEMISGVYKLSLTAADTNTLGDLVIYIFELGGTCDATILVDQVIAVDLMDAVGFGLSRIDATISSRSTFAGGAVSSVTGSVGSVTSPVTVGTNNDKTGYSLTVSPPTAAQIRTEMDTNSSKLDVAVSTRSTFAGGAVASVTAPVTVGTNNDKTGYSVTSVASVATVGTVTNPVTVGTNNDKTGYSVTSVGSVTTVGSVTNPVTVGTNNDKTGYSLTVAPPTVVQIRQEIDTNSTKLDVPVSTRSTYNGGPVSSVTSPVTVGANNDKSGYALTPTERISIADALLGRDLSAVVGAASRSLLNAIRFLRNKWGISGGILTVRTEDDTTVAWTAAVTTTPGSEPITTVDPV